MSYYPDKWHVVYFLQDALQALGVQVEFAKDERTLGCWGLVFPEYGNRVMVWLVDNRLPGERQHEDPSALELLNRGAIVAHAQLPDQQRIGGYWLPIGISPGFVSNTSKPKTCDVAMVAYVRDGSRASILADIGAVFTLNLSQGVFGDTAVDAYHTARCAINIPTQYGQPYAYDTANIRFFEVLATGTPLVTAHEDYLAELGFIDRVHYVGYRGAGGVISAIQYAIEHPEIGLNALELAPKHTYEMRAKQVIKWLSA